MKKNLLILGSLALLSLPVYADSDMEPVAKWGNLLDGSTAAGDQATGVTVDKDGNPVWFGNYGTTDASPDVNYAGTFLYSGALLNSASNTQNNNYTLLKTDRDGNKMWCVYSNSGDFANNSGFCAATSDGGIITVSKVRHTDGMTDRNISLTDATGKAHEVAWTCDRRFYSILVTKVSSQGEIEWNRLIKASTQPGPAAQGNYADFWADTFILNSGTVDEKGNIYIALNYRNPLYIPTGGGDDKVLTPANTASWNGDTQTAAGDFLLLSLDENGYYRNDLVLSGSCSASYCQNIVYDNGAVYAQGYIIGSGSTMQADSFTLSPSNIMSPLFLKADTDLKINWAKCCPGEQVAGKNAFQSVGISVYGNSFYVTGQYNLKFSDPDDSSKFVASTQGALREGFILRLDAATGAWLAARDSRDDDWNNPSAVAKTGLTGYLQPFVNPSTPETVYVYGYVMNAAVGVFLRGYDATTLEANLPDMQYNIITGGGVPSAQVIAFDDNTGSLYATARGNKAFTLSNGYTTPAPSGWGILLSRFDLFHLSTDIDAVTIVEESDAPVEYYNLQGIRVNNPDHGIYIVRKGPKTTKVIL